MSSFARVEIDKLPELIDSTDMLTKERAEIARRIYRNAKDFDGFQLGAISGGDMTPQTATQKRMYALGKARTEKTSVRNRIEYVRRIIQTNYAEEITVTGPREI